MMTSDFGKTTKDIERLVRMGLQARQQLQKDATHPWTNKHREIWKERQKEDRREKMEFLQERPKHYGRGRYDGRETRKMHEKWTMF